MVILGESVVGYVQPGELGHVALDGIVERQLAFVPQLQDRRWP